ncbi:nucleic acid-binding, OB-fold protein [Tanacetum coccineum]
MSDLQNQQPPLPSLSNTFGLVSNVDITYTDEVLRRLGSIFTSVYAAVQKLKKDSWKELQFSLVDNSKLNVGVCFTCEAMITTVRENIEWHYISCSQCTKKVTEQNEEYDYEDHRQQDPPIHRYNFKAKATDGTTNVQFIFFMPAEDKVTGSGEFTVDDILDMHSAIEGPSSIAKIIAGTPPHDVMDEVAKTIVTTIAAYKSEAATSGDENKVDKDVTFSDDSSVDRMEDVIKNLHTGIEDEEPNIGSPKANAEVSSFARAKCI